MEVLNKELYRLLRNRFGEVRVSNPGAGFRAVPDRGSPTQRLNILRSGENYRVCCPFCQNGDTRFHLYIHHRFGQRDLFNRDMRYMVNCFHGCMADDDNYRQFLDGFIQYEDDLRLATVDRGVARNEKLEVEWPGTCVPLMELPADHHVLTYLREERHFDPAVLSRQYDVRYCEHSRRYRIMSDRLVIPIYQDGVLRSWQGRVPRELPWKQKPKVEGLPPKYFTAPDSAIRKLIYNWDRMRLWRTGVLVEGPMDVWRFGAMAGCVFHGSATADQLRKLLTAFRRKTLILLLDPEEREKEAVKRNIAYLRAALGKAFADVWLPEGLDPAKVKDRAHLRRYVAAEARKQGTVVRWEVAA